MIYIIENDKLAVRVDSYGAEVKSVLSKETLREYMWYGSPKYWGRTSPVLFPFVGGVKDKKYNWKGTEYPMSQHGFARDMEFDLVDKTDSSISFILKSTPETIKKYPFEFELTITYELVDNELSVGWHVYNPATEKMYFSIGAHPAFLCPIHGEGTKAGYKLYFDGVEEIHHHGNDLASGLSTLDEDLILELENGVSTITNEYFDRCTYIIEGNQTGRVALLEPDNKKIVEVVFDTPLFAIWSPEGKNAPFLCIEPWYGRADATDFSGDLSQRDHTNILESLEAFDGGYKLLFF